MVKAAGREIKWLPDVEVHVYRIDLLEICKLWT